MNTKLKATLISSFTVLALLGALAVMPAGAIDSPEHYSLVDNANFISPGLSASGRAVQLVSDSATTTAWGSVEYGVEEDVTFSDLTYLGTEYKFEADDSCGGGSPRFFIEIDEDEDGIGDGHIFVYLGPSPDYTGCASDTELDSGDLLESGMTVDSSQLTGGTFYDEYDDALARYGDDEVLAIGLVADASWFFVDSEQTVVVDNTMINSTLITYEVPEEPTEDTEELCTDEIDNDEDTFIDEADPDCDPFFEEGSISGSKFNDVDGDGAWDGDEAGLAGWVIFLDEDGDGALDDGEASTTTDGSGDYSFTGLAADTYSVCEVGQEGWEQTAPEDCHEVILAEDEVSEENDFGNHELPPVAMDKDECKNGGWMEMTDDEGNSFKNQGQCIAFVQSSGNSAHNR